MAINFTPTPTGEQFMHSRAFMKLICGPVGGGKSTAALMEILSRCMEQVPNSQGIRKTKHIFLRNTVAQLKSTVKPLIDQWLIEMMHGQAGYWRLSDNIFMLNLSLADGTTVESELWLMAADTPDDVRRLLSVECSSAWVEEAREIDPDVFSGLQGRVNRYPNVAQGGVTRPGVICSTNPPPVGGFWHGIMTDPPKGWEIFIQPPALLDDGSLNPEAENLENLAADYYDNLIGGKSEDWIDVYLKNKFGAGNYGHPVYKGTFKRSFHVAKAPLMGILSGSAPLIVGMDNGLQAAAAFIQMDARNRVNVLDEVFVPKETTMGVDRFLDTLLIPKLRASWNRFTPADIIFVVDPACFQRSQATEITIAQVIQQRGYRCVAATTIKPEARINTVESLMLQQVDGMGRLLVSPTCTYLLEACEWGYRYKNQKGDLSTPTPEKNHHSHLSDALQYGCSYFTAPPVEFRKASRRNVVPVSSRGWT